MASIISGACRFPSDTAVPVCMGQFWLLSLINSVLPFTLSFSHFLASSPPFAYLGLSLFFAQRALASSALGDDGVLRAPQ
jgi:hypothetical protein